MIIIIKNQKGKISIEFPEWGQLRKIVLYLSLFYVQDDNRNLVSIKETAKLEAIKISLHV